MTRTTLMGATLVAVLVLSAIFAAGAAVAQDLYTFAGTQTYTYYAEKMHEKVLEDGVCPVSALLTFLGGQKVMLLVSEYSPCEPDGRTFPLFGKMTRSGSVKLEIPEEIPILDILKEHTGCSVAGPFPKYKGKFRDGVLHIKTHFTQQCDDGLFGIPVDGPVHGKWIIHLELAAP